MELAIFIGSRILVFFSSFLAQKTVPYLGFFPYKELLGEFNLPAWISSFANFDGIHYLLIAKNGYSQWEQAFFPLFPLVIKIISFIVPNSLIAALLISHVSFLMGIIFFKKLLHRWGIKTSLPIFFLLSFPTAFFFSAVYTEGLFFMLFVAALYFLDKKNYLVAGICAALSSSTRLIGVFLVVPFFFHFIADKKIAMSLVWGFVKRYIIFLLSPFFGLFFYMVYLFTTTGDPLFFFNSQPVFGAHRSTHFILLPQVYYRYLKILLTASHNFQWYLSFFEMSIFTLVFIILLVDLVSLFKQRVKKISQRSMLVAINLFSLINLVLPTLTGTFSSIPRYALFSLSFFLYVGKIQSRIMKVGLAIIFITAQIIVLSLFIQGYFVG